MFIKGIRLTKDVASTKIAYEKNGSNYVRTGKDGFKKGTKIKGDVSSVLATWGFRPVTTAPYFYDGEELAENINKFQMSNEGEITYNG